ncbi:MAG: hypothetical protein ABW125_03825 [Candidatus Thiodiazotropha lotti]
MSAIDKLIGEFRTGEIIDDNGSTLIFTGKLGNQEISLSDLESEIGDEIPASISRFIKIFGGSKLYVDEYGLGIEILRANEIIGHNLKQQITTDSFWPDFVIFGYISSDDMLVYCKPERKFGVLDHEAWGDTELWRTEATNWYDFEECLESLVRKKGDI